MKPTVKLSPYPMGPAGEVARVFAPLKRKLEEALLENEYDQADLVRRTTEDWRDYVAQLDRASAHLED